MGPTGENGQTCAGDEQQDHGPQVDGALVAEEPQPPSEGLLGCNYLKSDLLKFH